MSLNYLLNGSTVLYINLRILKEQDHLDIVCLSRLKSLASCSKTCFSAGGAKTLRGHRRTSNSSDAEAPGASRATRGAISKSFNCRLLGA